MARTRPPITRRHLTTTISLVTDDRLRQLVAQNASPDFGKAIDAGINAIWPLFLSTGKIPTVDAAQPEQAAQ